MSTTQAAPGWHPDPADPNGLRWWDGNAWTQHTQARPAATPRAGFPGSGATGMPGMSGATYGGGYDPGCAPAMGVSSAKTFTGMGTTGVAGRSFWSANTQSLVALAVAAGYLFLDLTSHIVILGIIPVAWSLRAAQRREQLAPVAIVAAVIAVIVGFTVLSHG